MVEYIDKEALLDDIAAAVENGGLGAVVAGTMKRYIMRVSAADVAPVMHGRWDTNADPGEEIKDFHCSVCEYLLCDIDTACIVPGENDFYFCPNCGAKMDLRGENSNGSEKA